MNRIHGRPMVLKIHKHTHSQHQFEGCCKHFNVDCNCNKKQYINFHLSSYYLKLTERFGHSQRALISWRRK